MDFSIDIKSKLRPTGFGYNTFSWIGEKKKIICQSQRRDGPNSHRSYYRGFLLNSLTVHEGSDVLVKVKENFDELYASYDVAKVIRCFFDDSETDPNRVEVQWYTYIDKVKKIHLKNICSGLPTLDGDLEIVRDMRNFETNIDIESIAGLCCDLILDQNIWILGQNRMMYRMDEGDNPRIIRLANQIVETLATTEPESVQRPKNAIGPLYVCRFIYDKKSPWLFPIRKETSVGSQLPDCKNVLKEQNIIHQNCQMLESNNEETSKENKTPDSVKLKKLVVSLEELDDGKITCTTKSVKRKLLDGKIDHAEKNDSKPIIVDDESKRKLNKPTGLQSDIIRNTQSLKDYEIYKLLSDDEESETCFVITPPKKNRLCREKLVKQTRKSTRVTTPSRRYAYSSEEEFEPESKKLGNSVTAENINSKRKPKATERLLNSSIKLSSKICPNVVEKTPIKLAQGRSSPSRKESRVSVSKIKSIKTRKDIKVDTPEDTKKESKSRLKSAQKSLAQSSRNNYSPKAKNNFAKLPSRKSCINQSKTEFELAREQLHISAVPVSIPCRENEFQQIFSFVEGKLLDSTGGCMYVSGVPGTGKTATVQEVVKVLKDVENDGALPTFDFIEVNAMKLTKPCQLYVQFWEKLTGARVTSDHACSLIEKILNSSGPNQKSIFLLLDELDLLWTKKQDVMYNLFDWSSRVGSRLIVVAIANTMDLPERMMISRVSSRIGLTRMTFQPYTFQQLQEIIASRLSGVRAFDPDAIQLVARKVAAVSGDARRALDVCRRATELAAEKPNLAISSPVKSPRKGGKLLVGMAHVSDAISEMFSSPKIMAIRRCSQMMKYILQAILAEFNRIGIEEAVLDKVVDHLNGICRLEGLTPPTSTEILYLLNVLSAQRVLFMEHSRQDLALRLRLNISIDDTSYALSL